MKIIILGAGYVGLVSAVCFAEVGFSVICLDHDEHKVKQLKKAISPIYEPNLQELLEKHLQNNSLIFSTDLKAHLTNAIAIFLAVGTPSIKDTAEVDLSYLWQAAAQIKQHLSHPLAIIIKSTVPVGTNKLLQEFFLNTGCEIISNPEFLREGFAIADFMQADRIIVGVNSLEAENLMREIYASFKNTPLMLTTPASAELIKYASNAFLATKVSFINEIADLCEVCEADVAQVSYGMSLDLRIGNKFLQVGPGYGGSCFPKDISALSHLFKAHNFNNPIIDAVIASNLRRKERLVQRIITILDQQIQDKVIACLGVSFKKNTDDIRESASIEILSQLLAKGAILRIYDPKALDNAKAVLGNKNISWCNGVIDAAAGACALLILTEWDEFNDVDYQQIAIAHIIDYRNLLLENKLHHKTKYHRLGFLESPYSF